MTDIYFAYINEERHDRLIKEVLPNFPDDYQNRILRFRRWQDAQLSLLGRLLLGYGLKKRDKDLNQRELFFNSNSKPYFKSENLEFNISHSENIVVCAISDLCEIGIDIELVREIEINDFKDQMTENEWRTIIGSHDVADSFFKYWTQKEAVLKAFGSGMTTELKSFEVLHGYTRLNDRDFYVKEININPVYTCYLACKEKIDTRIRGPIEVDSLILS